MSWGRMLHDSMAISRSVEKWWWIMPPGLAIAALSLSFILIGYAIDDILNPKLRQRR
jgi:peptide/nickel transport system permease protein